LQESNVEWFNNSRVF